MFLGYLPEIKDYHKYIWEALDMLGDGVINNCVTAATFVAMDNLLEKVVLDSDFGEHIIKQFEHFTKTNEINGDLKSVDADLDKFINLLEQIIYPEKHRQGENLLSYMYDKLYLLCDYLGLPFAGHNFCPYDYDEATNDLLNPDKLHIWLHVKSFFYWLFNKKTYDDTYTETVIYELKKKFCKVCRDKLSSYIHTAWWMRVSSAGIIEGYRLSVIEKEKEQSSGKNKENGNGMVKIDKPEPKLEKSANTLQNSHKKAK